MKNNTAIILILLAIGLFYTFTNVQYKSVKELDVLASEYRNVLENASAIIGLRDALLVTYSALPKTEIERMGKVLPDSIDTVRLALDLDSMASRYGISIENIQTVVGANKDTGLIVLPGFADGYDTATVTFSFTSNYENFKRFLVDIERSLRIMDITFLSFQAGDSGFYDYQVSVETYWIK